MNSCKSVLLLARIPLILTMEYKFQLEVLPMERFGGKQNC